MPSPFTRRQFAKLSAAAAASTRLPRALAQTAAPAAAKPAAVPPIAPGPFTGSRQSLAAYRMPDWFADAKFGIWNHWGPQSAAEYGDWYARRMYVQGEPQYDHHIQHYGHPSKTGFVDVINSWHADKFDADRLMSLYKKAGAKYYVAMGCHHDNFDMWHSRYQPQWNAVNAGPRRDILGNFAMAARKQDLRFGVSEHLSNSFAWFGTAHGADKTGPLAGVPYDGTNSEFSGLYHDYSQMPPEWVDKVVNAPAKGAIAMSREGPDSWRINYFNRILDVVSQHQPDLLYTDGGIPFGDDGLAIVAHLYNTSAARHNGKIEAIFTSKSRPDAENGMCMLDVERGVVDNIWPRAWQTDTCIGNWHYDTRARYKTPKRVVDMLVDIVSRNGNLLLNFPLPNSGWPDDKELAILDAITAWMSVNSEGIYATRPWKIFGAGPGADIKPSAAAQFNEATRQDLTADDVRFTTKGDVLYAFVMGAPGKQAVIPSLATGGPQAVGTIKNVELLGRGKVPYKQDATALTIQLPDQLPSDHAIAFKIIGA
jgi:alpha-L-fucosidase